MDKEEAVCIDSGVLVSHKKRKKLCHLHRYEWSWILSYKVNHKKKNKYCILMHICGIQKNGTDEPICKAEIETQRQRTNVWTAREKVGEGWDGRGD